MLNDNNDTTSPSKYYFPFGTNMLYLQNIHNLSNVAKRNNNSIDKESIDTSGNRISINEYRLYKLYYSINCDLIHMKLINNQLPLKRKLTNKRVSTQNVTINVTFSRSNVVYQA